MLIFCVLYSIQASFTVH